MELQTKKETAVKAYKDGDSKIKSVLEELFGKKSFLSAIERIKSYEDACADQNINPYDALPFTGANFSKEQEVLNAYAKLRIISKSLQEGWIADWTNSNQKKWYVWFDYKPGVGFVVDVTYYDCTVASTSVGSRLCLPTSELARYFGEQFIALHRIVLEN